MPIVLPIGWWPWILDELLPACRKGSEAVYLLLPYCRAT